MQELANPIAVHVRCAHCRLRLDVNKHILKPSAEWPRDKVHVVLQTDGFVGTVGCPECGHFTVYAQCAP